MIRISSIVEDSYNPFDISFLHGHRLTTVIEILDRYSKSLFPFISHQKLSCFFCFFLHFWKIFPSVVTVVGALHFAE